MNVKKRKLEYGDITGMNLLEEQASVTNLHTWIEEASGRTLIVGYMFPEEVPGVRLSPPDEKKGKEKPTDGGMFAEKGETDAETK